MPPSVANGTNPDYDVVIASKEVFASLLEDTKLAIPSAIISQASFVNIHCPEDPSTPVIPTPWRETEGIAAIKALEACITLAISELSSPNAASTSNKPLANISTDHASLQLFHSYLSTIDGYGKWDTESLPFLKPTDLYRAQSNLYRRLSANIYETRNPGVYYHTHGSLQATTILNALGLPGFLEPEVNDYDELCGFIGDGVKKFTALEMDDMTMREGQAGAMVLREDEFYDTDHGKAMKDEPVIKIQRIESPDAWKPVNFFENAANGTQQPGEKKILLKGLKVLDLTRVIAGPSISRTLAEYGASVLKITSPNLPDVPWYQVDLNFGKRTCELNLKDSNDRKTFEKLLDEDGGVDVVVDGYRPGSLERLGYGLERLTERWANRTKGFIYVSENCFGHVGPWKDRSGWQPIADAVSGLAWGHGLALGINQPILPPYPMSDYGTGAIGAAGALLAIYRRAIEGGSYTVNVSLTGWNLWIQSLGTFSDDVWKKMLQAHSPEIQEFKINHLSNFDVVSKAAIKSMRRLTPRLFDERYMFSMDCPGFKGTVRSMRPVVQYADIKTGFDKGKETRPNGFDDAKWY